MDTFAFRVFTSISLYSALSNLIRILDIVDRHCKILYNTIVLVLVRVIRNNTVWHIRKMSPSLKPIDIC